MIYLVRHGETEFNRVQRYQGWLDSPLTARMPGIFDGYDGSWYFNTPDGETYDEFAGRIGDCLAALANRPAMVVTHGVVTRVLRGIYAGLPRAEALRLPVPQDRFYRLAGGRIEEIAVSQS